MSGLLSAGHFFVKFNKCFKISTFFHYVHPRTARLHNIAASQKSFMPSKEDQQKALKRKNDERLNRGGKRSYLSQALD